MADPKDTRDLLDQRLSRVARAGRRPRGVPAPGPREPADDTLLRVVEGTASAAERAEVAAAEADSAFTRDRLAVLREALAETGHTGAVERTARYVFVLAKEALSLLRAATEPVALPAAATVRSGAAAPEACYYEFIQPFGNHEAHLKIEHVTRGAAASIDVQVKLPGLGRASGARITLLRSGETVDSMPVGDDGAATFSGLGRERYEIVVKQAGEDLGRVHLDFIG